MDRDHAGTRLGEEVVKKEERKERYGKDGWKTGLKGESILR